MSKGEKIAIAIVVFTLVLVIMYRFSPTFRADMNTHMNEVRKADDATRYVRVGNTLNYAPFVHEGTYKMKGRPYITDGLSGESHAKQLQKVAEENLKKGFEK